MRKIAQTYFIVKPIDENTHHLNWNPHCAKNTKENTQFSICISLTHTKKTNSTKKIWWKQNYGKGKSCWIEYISNILVVVVVVIKMKWKTFFMHILCISMLFRPETPHNTAPYYEPELRHVHSENKMLYFQFSKGNGKFFLSFSGFVYINVAKKGETVACHWCTSAKIKAL